MNSLEDTINLNELMGASYINVDTYLVRAIGNELAIFISVINDHNSYINRFSEEEQTREIDSDGWLCLPVEYIMEQLFIELSEFNRILQKAAEINILTLIKQGYPLQYWYKLNEEEIEKLVLKTEINRQDFIKERELHDKKRPE